MAVGDYLSPSFFLDANRESILDELQIRLHSSGSRILDDPTTAGAFIERASRALTETIEDLRRAANTPPIPHPRLRTSEAIVVSVPELITAANLLFDVTLDAVAVELSGTSEGARLMADVARALQRSLLTMVREGALANRSLLLQEVYMAQMVERRRISRELHDSIGHSVSIANHSLDLYRTYLDREPIKAAEKIKNAHDAIRCAMAGIRGTTRGLRAEAAVEQLESTLRSYIEEVCPDDVDVRISVRGDEEKMPGYVLNEIFLVIREALKNSFKHARARLIRVDVVINDKLLEASVVDDGIGFEISTLDSPGGIESLRERVALLGGDTIIRSYPQKGTTVTISVPVPGVSGADLGR
ncbi:sensor histidine kinase [Frankia sp. QA3]|uniref:sensor histidine kinase n=1 Tax=Frankia sp. QA3 TaxID=710111 RepID=UPI000269C658|nr:sensor histidine kinase [Frankia sp. QA3]EIV93561.1 signal transduction histidine kinase [Frankia sp. QA3]